MRAADGSVCPMHEQAASAVDPHATHRGAAAAAAEEECRMRGTCEGPAVALSIFFSVPAVMPADAVQFVPPTTRFDAPANPAFAPVPLTSDTPPPKA